MIPGYSSLPYPLWGFCVSVLCARYMLRPQYWQTMRLQSLVYSCSEQWTPQSILDFIFQHRTVPTSSTTQVCIRSHGAGAEQQTQFSSGLKARPGHQGISSNLSRLSLQSNVQNSGLPQLKWKKQLLKASFFHAPLARQ